MNKVLTPVLALAAVGGAVFATLQWNARAEAEAALAASNAKLGLLEKSMADALAAAAKAKADLNSELENVARLKDERDKAEKKAQEVAATAGAPGAAPADAQNAKPQFDMRNAIAGFAKGLDNPEQRKAMKSMQDRMIGGAYEKVFTELGLNEADSKLVTEVISERNFLALDRGRKVLEGKNDEASLSAIRKEIETVKAESDNKAKSILGEEKFRKLTAYEQTLGDRRGLDMLARDFERKGIPMAEAQKEELKAILIDERMKAPSNEIPDLGGGPGMALLMSDAEAKAKQLEEEAFQQRVLARAAKTGLTPDQISALEKGQKQQIEWKNAGRTMSRAFLMPQQPQAK